MDMKKRSAVRMSAAIICCAVLSVGTWVFAETMYVKVGSAQIRSGKTSVDAVVAWVRFGEKVEAVERQDNYILVKTIPNGPQGWIFFRNSAPRSQQEKVTTVSFQRSRP
jgi:uncharacterized protein YgiM (DUF1202 family)